MNRTQAEIGLPESGTTGLWLIGARGSVASTAVIGALAVRAGAADTGGMVTDLGPLSESRLPGLETFVFGGHDLNLIPLADKSQMARPNPTSIAPPQVFNDRAARRTAKWPQLTVLRDRIEATQ